MNEKNRVCLAAVLSVLVAVYLVLLGCASAQSSPITPQNAHLLNGQWSGTWRSGGSTGGALVVLRASREQQSFIADFTLGGTGSGEKHFRLTGTLEGEKLIFRSPGSVTRLALYGAEPNLVLRGTYEILTGRFAGERGDYEFRKLK